MSADGGEVEMPYTPSKPSTAESSAQLRTRIPGWGVDLNPRDRPSVPRLQHQADASGSDGKFPERQPERWPRERSIEHATLTPVFGTSCPPRGLSGAIRRLSYRKFSEARAAHWLLLLLADRVDSGGSTLRSFASSRPDNPITETGILAEFRYHGLRSRLGRRRADVRHQWVDPLIVLAPWAVRACSVAIAVRTLRQIKQRRPASAKH
jgi:hypothetical protein